MLSDEDYQEAVRRYKNMRVNGHERQRYHALILVHQGYSYREVGRILLVDEDTIRRRHTRRGKTDFHRDEGPVRVGRRDFRDECIQGSTRLLNCGFQFYICR